jgi:hypothetical protein
MSTSQYGDADIYIAVVIFLLTRKEEQRTTVVCTPTSDHMVLVVNIILGRSFRPLETA